MAAMLGPISFMSSWLFLSPIFIPGMLAIGACCCAGETAVANASAAQASERVLKRPKMPRGLRQMASEFTRLEERINEPLDRIGPIWRNALVRAIPT